MMVHGFQTEEMPSTEMRKTGGRIGLRKNQKFCFIHIQFEMPLKYSSGKVKKTIK